MRSSIRFAACSPVIAAVALLSAPSAAAQDNRGSIVGWGTEIVGVDLSHGFVSVAAGWAHSLGLKTDGSIVAWGNNDVHQCDVPKPNSDFVAIMAAGSSRFGLRADGSIVAWGYNNLGQCNVPEPNTGFAALDGGEGHVIAIRRFSRGDVNCDRGVDFDDIDPFVVALSGREKYRSKYPDCEYSNGDVDGDGDVDLDDIDGFVECLINGGCA